GFQRVLKLRLSLAWIFRGEGSLPQELVNPIRVRGEFGKLLILLLGEFLRYSGEIVKSVNIVGIRCEGFSQIVKCRLEFSLRELGTRQDHADGSVVRRRQKMFAGQLNSLCIVTAVKSLGPFREDRRLSKGVDASHYEKHDDLHQAGRDVQRAIH